MDIDREVAYFNQQIRRFREPSRINNPDLDFQVRRLQSELELHAGMIQKLLNYLIKK